MRFRLVERKDFATCRSLLNPATRLSRRVLDRLPALWRVLAAFSTFAVVEDPMKPFPDCIEGFGASAFVSDQFVDDFAEARRHYLDAALYERMLDGPSPVLSESQLGRANSGDGLNLIVLNFGLRDHDISAPRAQSVLQIGSSAFYTLHAGYRLKFVLNEVFGEAAARYMRAGGFRQLEREESVSPTHDGDRPYLFALSREWVRPGAIHTLSFLFHPPPSQIGFSPAEQRVLVLALLNATDA